MMKEAAKCGRVDGEWWIVKGWEDDRGKRCQLFPTGFHRRDAEGEEGDEQKENLTQRTKGPSQQVTNHESQITVERSETQHKGTEAQRSEGKREKTFSRKERRGRKE